MPSPPSVRTWFSDEIANILQAVAMSNGDIADAVDTPEMRIYKRGFDAALNAIAAAIGIDPPRRPSRNTITGDSQ